MTEQERIAITKYDLYYEQRMTKVETAVENLNDNVRNLRVDIKEIESEIKADFRWLLGMMVALFGLMAHGFHWF